MKSVICLAAFLVVLYFVDFAMKQFAHSLVLRCSSFFRRKPLPSIEDDGVYADF